MERSSALFFAVLLAALIAAPRIEAQATEFSYQGQLQSAAALANGNFDFEFLLFDGGGSQIGSTITRNGVAVANGVFAVNLDFGPNFPGASRFLEIRVRQSGGGGFTTLSPRQPVTSTPYSVKSLSSDTATNSTNAVNATNATTAVSFSGVLSGDVTGSQNSATVVRLQGRNVANTAPLNDQVLKFNSTANQWLPGTDNTGAGGGGTITGVMPGTGLAGGGSSGSVTLNIANGGVGTSQLADGGVTDAKINDVSGSKVTGTVANSTTAVTATTAANATQLGGIAANQYLQTNGNGSGLTNLNAGSIATGTLANARLGQIPTGNIADGAITAPKIAGGQVIKGLTVAATTLTDNVTLAAGANISLTPAGNTVTIASTGGGGVGGSGTTNTIPLWSGGTTLTDSQITQSAVGVQLPNGVQLAVGAQGNQLAFGSPNGETGLSISSPGGPRADLRFDGTTIKLVARPAGTGPPNNGIVIDNAGNVGIGTPSVNSARLRVDGFNLTGIVGVSSFDYGLDGQGTLGGTRGFSNGNGRGVYGISISGVGVEGSSNGSNNFGVFSSGFMGLNRLGTGGITTLCLNASNQIATCGSSLRYKTDLQTYAGGLDIINRLQPITYRWKSDNSQDIGFVAESVAEIDPLLTIHNDKGEVEGVKYDRLSTVFVNAIKEQQRQIENQQKKNESQQKQIEMLTKVVCSLDPKAEICR
ncbi:MAG TPA: tail fiber domain-containing protein [Pyrinomonadaceae bacterium]|nr:tail fiber domain-containing protein [Acidobacteriota bacterium]HQY68740.1 tail fiber domain-containing protein [Pyrinomonadaceae bacterium]